jgi:hypothetical protein
MAKKVTYLAVNFNQILPLHRLLTPSFAISTLHYHLDCNLYIGFDQFTILLNPGFDNLRILRVGHNYKNDNWLGRW